MSKIINAARSEAPADYVVKPSRKSSKLEPVEGISPEDALTLRKQYDDKTIAQALAILDSRLKQPGEHLGTPTAVKTYLRLQLAQLEHEVFVVLFLDVKNRLIAQEEMFRGSLTATSVYPREVVKAALLHNAASIMLSHNHPSGSTEPSQSDLLLTRALTQACALVDVRVLDHFIVAGAGVYSFAEHGQI